MPSIVICDPSNKLPLSVCDALTRRFIPYAIVRAGCDCAALVRTSRPDVVLISSETDNGFLGRVLTRVENASERDRPATILLMGDETPTELSHRWGLPIKHCLQNPIDASSLLELIQHRSSRIAGGLSSGAPSSPPSLRDRPHLTAAPPHADLLLGPSVETRQEAGNASSFSGLPNPQGQFHSAAECSFPRNQESSYEQPERRSARRHWRKHDDDPLP